MCDFVDLSQFSFLVRFLYGLLENGVGFGFQMKSVKHACTCFRNCKKAINKIKMQWLIIFKEVIFDRGISY